MATYGFAVDVYNSKTADEWADILRRVLQALDSNTVIVTTGTWSAGTTSVNTTLLTIGTGTIGWAVRVTVVDTLVAEIPRILRRILQALDSNSPIITFGTYAAGDRVYNALVAVSA